MPLIGFVSFCLSLNRAAAERGILRDEFSSPISQNNFKWTKILRSMHEATDLRREGFISKESLCTVVSLPTYLRVLFLFCHH